MSDNKEKIGIHSSELFLTLLPMLEESRKAVFTVSGMSMWPFICHGRDQVIVTACDPQMLKIGDIILFQPQFAN